MKTPLWKCKEADGNPVTISFCIIMVNLKMLSVPGAKRLFHAV